MQVMPRKFSFGEIRKAESPHLEGDDIVTRRPGIPPHTLLHAWTELEYDPK